MSGIKYEHHAMRRLFGSVCPFKVEFDTAEPDSMANWHKNPEIIYITDGDGTVQCGAQCYNAKKGDIFVINTDIIHNVCSNGNMGYYFIIIDEGFCRNNGIEAESYRFRNPVSDDDAERVVKRITDIYGSRETENPKLCAAKLRTAVMELLVRLCENYAEYVAESETVGNSDMYVRKAMVYISENYSRRIVTEDIAKSLGITKFHLAREFRKHTGETVISHINKVRCTKARQMINGGYSVTVAAMECGFESVSYFSQKFKKIMGISPREYIRNINQ
ncbi:MAG: helix-turn-helix transcriptional regulator [Clostridia bacterium]|nr:helix-turn-helix transcriptional regulator [Clostridia bacterium]